MTWRLIEADCIEAMQQMEDSSVDAMVTDPPYGIHFMGKTWDRFGGTTGSDNTKHSQRGGAMHAGTYDLSANGLRGFQAQMTIWATEALRVLKPGGHLLAFGGTRTYHRLACAIEDAGFEIRDCLAWMYGSGFPKSLDVSKAIDKQRDDRADVERVVRYLEAARVASGVSRADVEAHFGTVNIGQAFFTITSGSAPRVPSWEQWNELRALFGFGDEMDAEVWRLNGRKGQPDVQRAREEPQRRARPSPAILANGFGADGFAPTVKVPVKPDAQTWQGWGTALKPAFEPIVMARKPLIGTVAANVLEHGTGALNIDGTRIGNTAEDRDASERSMSGDAAWRKAHQSGAATIDVGDGAMTMNAAGRWPANVVLDEAAAALLDEQTGERPSAGRYLNPEKRDFTTTEAEREAWILGGRTPLPVGNRYANETGGASRFYYVAKSASAERNRGTERNTHPTVKPVELMQWLCRLVTPPGGVVLDPFTGSGSTGIAALREGFRFVGIEREAEYVEIARDRIIGDAPLFNVSTEVT